MATLYNAVSKNNNNKTLKVCLKQSDLVYIHDAGGFDLNDSQLHLDESSMPLFPNHNKYSCVYGYRSDHHYLTTVSDITDATSGGITINTAQYNVNLGSKIQRLRRTLPYVKNLSNYSDYVFYYNEKYYTPYVIHIGLQPINGYQPNKSGYVSNGYTYAYLPNIALYSDIYCGVWSTNSSSTESPYDMTQYSPAFHIMGNNKSIAQYPYAYYLGSYFYRYIWCGNSNYSDRYDTNFYSNPLQGISFGNSGSGSSTNVFSRATPNIVPFEKNNNRDISIASAISYIDLVVQFNENYVDQILNTQLIEYVFERHNNDNYDYSYTYITDDTNNSYVYFRFVRECVEYTSGHWGEAEHMKWGIWNNSAHAVETLITGDYWGMDDSNLHILYQFWDLLMSTCDTFFYVNSSITDSTFIDYNEYMYNNNLVIKSAKGSQYNATIKAIHINVVNNTSYINAYNSCSIIENQYQYWYGRIGGAFKQNMINIYVNNGKIKQGTIWGWNSVYNTMASCTQIHIYNGSIYYNNGNKSPVENYSLHDGEKFFENDNPRNPIISVCKELDYIENTSATVGSAPYIDTGISPSKYLHMYIEFTPTTIPTTAPTNSNSYNTFLCGAATGYSLRYNLGFAKVNNVSQIFAYYRGYSKNITNNNITLSTDKRYWIEMYCKAGTPYFKCGIVGGYSSEETQIYGTQANVNTIHYTIHLFGSRANSNALSSAWKGKIHCCKIWDEYDYNPNYNNLLIDLIPVCYNPAGTSNGGTYCMYDRISKQLFYNAGSGSFIGGPQVYTSNGTLRIWIDDFYDRTGIAEENDYQTWEGYIYTVIHDITHNTNMWGANPYEYTGETFEWNNSNYYIWQYNDELIGSTSNDVKYLLTDTIDYTELYERSIDNNPDNYGGIVCFLNNDLEEYRIVENSEFSPTEESDSIIVVEKLNNYL